ncbi:MAG: sensor histidine kinase, partial [Vicinamibacterales bacterium]
RDRHRTWPEGVGQSRAASRIEAAGREGMVVARVSDTGTGISAELLPRVFDRQVRGQAQGSKARSGLGLAIVKRIVDAHGGNVTIQSTPGSGTTALVLLPIATPV